MSDHKLYGSIVGTNVEIRKGISPLAEVVEVIECSSRGSAEKALSQWLKSVGKTFGGRYK